MPILRLPLHRAPVMGRSWHTPLSLSRLRCGTAASPSSISASVLLSGHWPMPSLLRIEVVRFRRQPEHQHAGLDVLDEGRQKIRSVPPSRFLGRRCRLLWCLLWCVLRRVRCPANRERSGHGRPGRRGPQHGQSRNPAQHRMRGFCSDAGNGRA
ncbi:hypothetical protein DFJ74DRAFT_656648 [Hyaloraphidium curvatum]|nr:hypothetical protein DFJ74DRAFT_656648 [Hyaloraphidium curvatum]